MNSEWWEKWRTKVKSIIIRYRENSIFYQEVIMKVHLIIVILLLFIMNLADQMPELGFLEKISKKGYAGIKEEEQKTVNKDQGEIDFIKIFMCGDVMTGRGIDQIMLYPSDPVIYELYLRSAVGYVDIAEEANGPIPQPVDFAYIWGNALEELKKAEPDLRMINLETSITKSNDHWKGKGINYRMNPKNIPCITVAKIDHCSLANNHVLDWDYPGLTETLETLKKVNIKTSGAGKNLKEAETPAIIEVNGKGRVIIFSFGSGTSGIPSNWAATEHKAGVNLLKDLSLETVSYIKDKVKKVKQIGDIVIASIHWGSNWGYHIPPEQTDFAHKLIENAGLDLIYGHSSHHVKGIEVYKNKLIIYGCGDFLNDYEGIGGKEEYRANLSLMYFVNIDPSTGDIIHLRMVPTEIKHFRVNLARTNDVIWMKEMLIRESKYLGTGVELGVDNSLMLKW